MEHVFDKNKCIVKILIKTEYYNNYSIFKQEYIKKLPFIEDEKILKILKCNYLLYGIVLNEMINGHINGREYFYFKNLEIIQKSIIIEHPIKIFDKVNLLINHTTKFLDIINNNYSKIMDYDYKIMDLLIKLKKTNLLLYLDNFVCFNNIRLFINHVFFEYYQDMNYINNKLIQCKYDYFILEPDIYLLNLNLTNLLDNYNDNKKFILCLDDKKVNFKIFEGDIDIENISNIIEEKMIKLSNFVS